ncbi:MAG: hypothetical protein LBL82_07790 [Oscillospiraceae bacterium]|nr:hypothetical protein [Oscillospiraceae bacterium]
MNFYRLQQDEKYPHVWYNNEADLFESVICPEYPGHQRGRRSAWSLSVEVKKRKFGDFVYTSYSDCLITDKVAEIFKQHNFTGYELRPVDVCNMVLPFNLWELVVTGNGGEAHPDSGMFIKRQCPYCKNTYYSAFKNGTGIVVDENNWDGSDFFTLTPLPKFILINEKVRAVIKENKLKGVIPILSTEITRDERFDGPDGGEVSPF